MAVAVCVCEIEKWILKANGAKVKRNSGTFENMRMVYAHPVAHTRSFCRAHSESKMCNKIMNVILNNPNFFLARKPSTATTEAATANERGAIKMKCE